MSDRAGPRFGLSIWLDNPLDGLGELARAAEDAGFDDVWVPDHYFLRDPFIAMTIMATATTRIRVGTAVAAALLRHPAALASSTATLSELSGGRAMLGIGPGGHEFANHFEMRPKSPLSLVREAATVARDLFHGRSDRSGKVFTTQGAQLGWSPPPSPIYMAARGTKMLELAGEVADGVLIHGITRPYVQHVRELVATGAARAGRRPEDCEIGVILDAEIDEDERAAVDALKPRLKVMAGGHYSDDLIPLYELDPDEVARLRQALKEEDPQADRFVTDSMVHSFALAGSASSVAKRCAELHDAGIDRIVVFSHGTPEHTANQIRLFQPILQEVNA